MKLRLIAAEKLEVSPRVVAMSREEFTKVALASTFVGTLSNSIIKRKICWHPEGFLHQFFMRRWRQFSISPPAQTLTHGKQIVAMLMLRIAKANVITTK